MSKLRLGLAAAMSGALALIGPMGPSWAAGTVTITGKTVSGNTLTVTGGSTYTDQPYVTLGEDGAADTLAPGQDALGGDLVKAEMASLANGNLGIRWTTSQMPAQPVPGFVYGWTFCLNESDCFEVDAARTETLAGGMQTYGNVWKCADASCVPGDQTLVNKTIRPTFDVANKTVTMLLTGSLLGLAPGKTITPVGLSTMGAAFVGNGDLSAVTYFYNTSDGVSVDLEFAVAGKQVSLAVGPADQDPATVEYTTTVSAAANGSYSAGLDISGLSGTQTIYARACLGEGNCGYATSTVTL